MDRYGGGSLRKLVRKTSRAEDGNIRNNYYRSRDPGISGSHARFALALIDLNGNVGNFSDIFE